MPASESPTRAPLTVSTSIVTADLLALGKELERLHAAGVDSLHLDIEDGTFVPVMNLGTRLVEESVNWGRLPVDVHLMVDDPEQAVRLLGALPLRSVAVHVESTHYPRRLLRKIKEQGWLAGLAINPMTPVPELATLKPYLDYVLMLTTEPEDGDSQFVESRLRTVRSLAIAAAPLGVSVTVDGGVTVDNSDSIADAGADSVVVGRALFTAPNLAQTVQRIKKGIPA